MDKLKEQLKTHFDTITPSEEFLQKLSTLDGTEKAPAPALRRYLWPLAAMLAVTVGICTFWHYSRPSVPIADAVVSEPASHDVRPTEIPSASQPDAAGKTKPQTPKLPEVPVNGTPAPAQHLPANTDRTESKVPALPDEPAVPSVPGGQSEEAAVPSRPEAPPQPTGDDLRPESAGKPSAPESPEEPVGPVFRPEEAPGPSEQEDPPADPPGPSQPDDPPILPEKENIPPDSGDVNPDDPESRAETATETKSDVIYASCSGGTVTLATDSGQLAMIDISASFDGTSYCGVHTAFGRSVLINVTGSGDTFTASANFIN